MRVCLIGGIYGADGAASGYLRVTPETTLEAGLRRAGHQVTTLSHYASADFGRFDIVHVHHLSYGAARLASDASPARFVFTPHDASEMSGQPLGWERRAALRFVLSRADRIVALSVAEARFVEQAYGVPEGRIASIPNGIDPTRFPFHRRNSPGQGQPWRLLFVGQLIALKGCDLLLRAVAALDEDVELRLAYQAGDREDALKELARELGISARTHFIGRQEPHQLAKLYQTSDLLVVASETEALPSVITEAMLSGLPFVSTDVGGVREQAAGFGYLLSRRTEPDLAKAIAHVLRNYEHYERTAEAMSRHASSTYTVDAMVARHEALYEAAASEAGARRHRFRYAAGNAVVRALVERFGRRSRKPAPARPDGPKIVSERT